MGLNAFKHGKVHMGSPKPLPAGSREKNNPNRKRLDRKRGFRDEKGMQRAHAFAAAAFGQVAAAAACPGSSHA